MFDFNFAICILSLSIAFTPSTSSTDVAAVGVVAIAAFVAAYVATSSAVDADTAPFANADTIASALLL